MRKIAVSLSPRKSAFGPLLFSGDLELGLRAASSLGFDCVELSLLDSERIDQRWLVATLSELSLSVSAIATGQTYYTDGYSLFHAEAQARVNCVKRIKDHIKLAERLGCGVIIGGIRGVVANTGDGRAKQERDGKDALRECALYARERAVTLLIEPVNRYETNIVNTMAEGLSLISEIGLENLSLLPDTFHMNIEEPDMEQVIVSAGAAVGYVHFADSNRLAPGWGHINFPGILASLASIGYQGTIGVEVLPKPDDLSAARQAITYLRGLAEHS